MDYQYFETHIHLGSDQFKKDVESQLQLEPRFQYLNVATSISESHLVVQQSKKYRNVYCSVGVHPLYISQFEEELQETYETLQRLILENDHIIAIGECGLDFYKVTKESSYDKQVTWLKMQLELSDKFNLPIILHLRNAYAEALTLLREYRNLKIIIHSFDGSVEELREFQKILKNYYISFSPLIFRNFKKFRELISLVPEERILVESDAPFLSTGSSICRSIVRIISNIKEIPLRKISTRIYQNSLTVFDLRGEV